MMTCPACTGPASEWATLRDRMHGIPGTYAAHRCEACATIFLAPQPDDQDLAAHYPERYTVWQHDAAEPTAGTSRARAKGLLTRPGVLGGVAARALSRFAGIETFALARANGSPGRLLDVGSGGGEVLDSFARLSWSTYGVEPGHTAAERSRARGHTIVEEDFATAQLEPGFDLIVFSHSLEHMRDPCQSLGKAAALLAPGGQIFVATPNASSLLQRIARRNWWQLDAPRHLVVLSGRGLRAAAQRAGLHVTDLHTHSVAMGPLVSRRLARDPGFLIEQWRAEDEKAGARGASRALSAAADLIGVGDNLHATLRSADER